MRDSHLPSAQERFNMTTLVMLSLMIACVDKIEDANYRSMVRRMITQLEKKFEDLRAEQNG